MRRTIREADKLLREVLDVFQSCRNQRRLHVEDGRFIPEDVPVRELCDRYGYGAVMDSAHRQWLKKHGDSAHTTGPCQAVLDNLLDQVEAFLKKEQS